jgi:hypothetical protein
MCWRQATVRPLKSEAATAAPNEVVIGVVQAIHSSSASSTTQVKGHGSCAAIAGGNRGGPAVASLAG